MGPLRLFFGWKRQFALLVMEFENELHLPAAENHSHYPRLKEDPQYVCSTTFHVSFSVLDGARQTWSIS